jgi:hypothetical protein
VSAGDNVDKEGNTYDAYFYNASSFRISNYNPGSFRGFSEKDNELLLDLESDIELEEIADVVMNHTVLEHVFNVWKAFSNLCKLSRDIVILITPFIQCQHETNDYKDYWRMTPTCLRRMFEENNMEVIYQSVNEGPGVYVFTIASKNALKWKETFPKLEIITKAGNWIA